MSRYGWPCGCPQCMGDDDERDEFDAFEEWAEAESERQLEAATAADVERAAHDWEALAPAPDAA